MKRLTALIAILLSLTLIFLVSCNQQDASEPAAAQIKKTESLIYKKPEPAAEKKEEPAAPIAKDPDEISDDELDELLGMLNKERKTREQEPVNEYGGGLKRYF